MRLGKRERVLTPRNFYLLSIAHSVRTDLEDEAKDCDNF